MKRPIALILTLCAVCLAADVCACAFGGRWAEITIKGWFTTKEIERVIEERGKP